MINRLNITFLITLGCILVFLPSCYSPLLPEPERVVACYSSEGFDYLEYSTTWDSLCTSELCSTYTAIWKELMIDRSTLTEPYFNRHFEVTTAYATSGDDETFFIGYKVQNDWAIAFGGDAFVIKIAEENTKYPEIGLPRDTYLSRDEITALLDNRGFNSKIDEIPKTGPLKYASREEAINALILEAEVETLCFNRIFLSNHMGTLTLEAFAEYQDEKGQCIKGTIDLITGQTNISSVACDRVYGH